MSQISSRTATSAEITYRPFLLAKRAEKFALNELGSVPIEGFAPVYVIPPREWDYEDERYKKTLDLHISRFPADFSSIAAVRRAYLDVSQIEADGLLGSGVPPMRWLIDDASARGLTLIPMVSAGSSPVTVAAAAASPTVAITLRPEHWPSIDPRVITNLLTRLAKTPDQIDLFLDCDMNFGALVARAAATEVSHVRGTGGPFNTVTFAGGSFPKTAPAGAGNHEIERQDLDTYQSLVALCTAQGTSPPDFADWTINHPDPTLDVDPKILNISATFRYAAESIWVLGKGGLYKGNGGRSVGGAAVAPMLNTLVTHPLFRSVLATGAEVWVDAARSGGSPGNATTWRQWATLRHIALTMHQLARLP